MKKKKEKEEEKVKTVLQISAGTAGIVTLHVETTEGADKAFELMQKLKALAEGEALNE